MKLRIRTDQPEKVKKTLETAMWSMPAGFELGSGRALDQEFKIIIEDPQDLIIQQDGMGICISEPERIIEREGNLPVITEIREKILRYLYEIANDDLNINCCVKFSDIKEELGCETQVLSTDLAYLKARGLLDYALLILDMGTFENSVIWMTLEGHEFYEMLLIGKRNRIKLKTVDEASQKKGDQDV